MPECRRINLALYQRMDHVNPPHLFLSVGKYRKAPRRPLGPVMRTQRKEKVGRSRCQKTKTNEDISHDAEPTPSSYSARVTRSASKAVTSAASDEAMCSGSNETAELVINNDLDCPTPSSTGYPMYVELHYISCNHKLLLYFSLHSFA